MRRYTILFFLLTALYTISFSQETDENRIRDFSFSADYLYVNPFGLLNKHELFLTSTYKNKYRLRVSYAFPAILLNKT